MTANLIPQGKQQYFDAVGNPLSGGKVYTYAAGTSTPLATYSDAAGTIPNANPVILNARGEATIYWADANYKVTLRDSTDGLIWTQDNVDGSQVADLLDDLSANGGAGLVGTDSGNTVQDELDDRAFTDFANVVLTGQQVVINTTSAAQSSKVGEHIVATNSTTGGQYGVRYAELRKTGRLTGGVNDIADALITQHNDIGNGYVWGRWNVTISPLNPASGLPGAPTLAQAFFMVLGEDNPLNRYANTAWQPETRGMATSVGGYQMVAETQDFSGALGTGVRVGYNISFGYTFAQSPYTNSITQRHAKFYNGTLVNPNAIAPGGYVSFATGYRQFPTAVAISAAGSGYTVGDLLTFNTGLSSQFNQDTVVRVKTVNGAGAVTGIEVYVSGWYQQSFASPIGVTGGTGTGATFTYTLSVEATEVPAAHTGMAGSFVYGIDAAPQSVANTYTGKAHFTGAMFRAPNADNILVFRNAADNADILSLSSNASNELLWSNSGTQSRFRGPLILNAEAASGLTTNKEMSFTLVSNTSLVVSVRGTDGVTRTSTITLS